MSKTYEPGFFVGRADILTEISQWAIDRNGQRLFSIIGAPGIGKSWVLGRAKDQLGANDQLVLPAYLNQNPNPNPNESNDDLTNASGVRAWLPKIVKFAQDKCGSVIRDFDPLVTIDSMIDALAQDLCTKCRPTQPVILLVDGLYEISDDAKRKWLEERVLIRFLGYECFRILLARRDENGLRPALRDEEIPRRLSPLDVDKNEHQAQLEKRITLRYSAEVSNPTRLISALLGSFQPYAWNHPYLNTLLLTKAVPRYQSGHNPILTADDLRFCIAEVPLTLPFAQEHFDCLVQLAHLQASHPTGWSESALRNSVHPDGLSHKPLIHLSKLGMVIKAPSPRQGGYLVVEGIFELIRAWSQLPVGGIP